MEKSKRTDYLRTSRLAIYLCTYFLCSFAFASTNSIRAHKNKMLRASLKEECLSNVKFLNKAYNIQCEENYHHYNSSAYKTNYNRKNAIKKGSVKIAEFNALHPGMGKSRFKDFKKVAQLINQYDIVGVVELIPSVAEDLLNNKSVKMFMAETPLDLIEINKEINSLKMSIASTTRSTIVKKRRLRLLKKRKIQLNEDLRDAASLYRTPGYLKILDQLHKLKNGTEWSLILAPRGEGAISTPVPELTGYYYRTGHVKPKPNQYCKSIRKLGRATPVACIINMDKADLGSDKRDAFSRRPFMAEFISGKFSFALITSHVLFNEPRNEEAQQTVLRKAFGVTDYKELGPGVDKKKYARFAEVKMTLDFIQRNIRKNNSQKDVIFMGDFNLEKKNPFWKKVLQAWDDSHIYVSGKTSVSGSRYDSEGNETFGQSSNYDHFIFNPRETNECINRQSNSIDGGVDNFITGRISNYINKIYKVRNERFIPGSSFLSSDPEGAYELNDKKYKKAVKKFIHPKINGKNPILTIKAKYISSGRYRIKSRGIVVDEAASDKYAQYFRTRVLGSQLSNKTYYKYFMQLLSDHFPIYMNCRTN